MRSFLFFLSGCLLITLGFLAGLYKAETPAYQATIAESKRKAAVPGLYFQANTTVRSVSHLIPNGDTKIAGLIDSKDGKGVWGYVDMRQYPIGTKVAVYEMQPGGGRWLLIEGKDHWPQPADNVSCMPETAGLPAGQFSYRGMAH